MVTRIDGAGPVPPPQDNPAQIAANFKTALENYVAECSSLNPDNDLSAFAQHTLFLAQLGKQAQSC